MKRQAERLKAEAESNMRLIIESVKDFAIFSVDVEGRVNTWNAGAERLFGWPEAEIIGQDLAVIFAPEDRAEGIAEKELRDAVETGRGVDERWHRRKDGSRFFASGMVRPIRDEAGVLRGFTKVARDITGRKRAEGGPPGERGPLPYVSRFRPGHDLAGGYGQAPYLLQ